MCFFQLTDFWVRLFFCFIGHFSQKGSLTTSYLSPLLYRKNNWDTEVEKWVIPEHRWCQQNGRVGSSKLLSLHINTENTSSNCENQLLQNFWKGSKVYSNQTNAELGKRQLKNGKKALWHFYLFLLHPLPGSAAILTSAASTPTVALCPWFQREQNRPYSQIIVFVCPNLSGG